MRRLTRTLALCLGLMAASPSASAKKIPVLLNFGVGPAAWTMMGGVDPERDWIPGVQLRLEAVVTKKTLKSKAVMKRVPKAYRDMVRSAPDMHVRNLPVMLVPDALVLGGSADGNAVFGAGWAPIGLSLFHKAGKTHTMLKVQPRVMALSLREGPDADAQWFGHVGLALNPDVMAKVAKRLWLGAGWESSVGLPLVGEDGPDVSGMFHIGHAYAMVHVRVPIKVKI